MKNILPDPQAGLPWESAARDGDDDTTPSLTSRVVAALRHDIILGLYRPGSKLAIVALAKAYACGATATREALSRLVSEGIVSATDNKGFRVARVSRADLIDLTTTRAEIDAVALKKSIALGDAAWEAEILAAYHRLACSPKPDMSVRSEAKAFWDGLHNDFHLALISSCRSPRLIALRNMLFTHAERYRNLSALYAGWVGRDAKGEHKDLMDAVLARDANRAAELIAAHYWNTCHAILELIDDPRSRGAEILS